MGNSLSLINALPSNPTERGKFIEAVKDELAFGHYKIEEIWPQLKAIETLIKELTADSEIRDILSAAIAGRPECGLTEQQVKKYNYAECRDSEWEAMQSQMNSLKASIKAREDFLKNIPTTGTINPETGEMIYPPVATFETRFVPSKK